MKLTLSPSLHKELLDARFGLRQLLMNEHESQLRKSRITYYNLMNKPSKLMARRVAAVRHKTKILFLISQSRDYKITNPKDIANEFSDFYSKLYNLKDNPQVKAPQSPFIIWFLK